MGAGQAKIELLLELRNRIKSGLSSARDNLSKGVSSMKAKLKELKASGVEAFSAMRDQIPGLNSAIGLLSNPYAAITAGIVALGAAYYQAGQMANEWQSGMAKINVTAQLSQKELKTLSEQLLEIGGRNTTDIMQVTDTFNKIISAGFDVNTSLKTLEPTLLAAKAGFTDAGIAADAATNLMGSSGITDATKIYDILFATLNKGKAEFADIANYLPKIIPGARMAGVSLEQTAGMYAYLTATGLKAEAASTALANAMKALSDPDIIYGTKQKGGFKALGVDIFDAKGEMRDIIAISTDLNKALTGLTTEQRINKFADIGLDMEASTAFAKMSQGINQLKEDIDFTTNSQGQLNEAINNSREPMDSWKIIINQVKKEMIGAGGFGVTAFGAIGDRVLEIINYFKNLYKESMLFRDIISAIGLVFEVAFKIASAAITTVWNIIKNVWWALVSVKEAIFGAGDGFEQWYLKIKPYILWVYQYLAGIAKVAFSIATLDFNGLKEGAKALANGKGIDDIRNEVKKEYNERKNAPKTDPEALVPPTGTTGKTTGGTGKQKKTKNGDVDKVTGSQQQVRNITINMDSMVKMGDFVSKNPEVAGMSKRELEQWFTELCFRMLRNIETSYS